VEDADSDIVPGVFSFGPHQVCRANRWWWPQADVFTGAVLCRGDGPETIRASICGDWGGLGGAKKEDARRRI